MLIIGTGRLEDSLVGAEAGLWLTAVVQLDSERDENPANNLLYYIFMVNDDGRVVESRIKRGTPRGSR